RSGLWGAGRTQRDLDVQLLGDLVESSLEITEREDGRHAHLHAHRIDRRSAFRLGPRVRLHLSDRDVALGEDAADASHDSCLVDARREELVNVTALSLAVRHRGAFEWAEEHGQTSLPFETLAGAGKPALEICVAPGEEQKNGEPPAENGHARVFEVATVL